MTLWRMHMLNADASLVAALIAVHIDRPLRRRGFVAGHDPHPARALHERLRVPHENTAVLEQRRRLDAHLLQIERDGLDGVEAGVEFLQDRREFLPQRGGCFSSALNSSGDTQASFPTDSLGGWGSKRAAPFVP